MADFTISDIEMLTERQANYLAEEKMVIKGFNVYFINFQGAFGHSYVVFKNDHQIKYANDYELHHGYTVRKEGLEGLRKYYLEQLSNKLYTDEEIGEPLKDYDDYEFKSRFLHNYYGLQEDSVSMFRIFRNEDDEKAFDEEVKDLIFNPVGFCYMDKKLKGFIDHHVELLKKLNEARDNVADNYEYQKTAFLYEMANHEYAINHQGNWDVLSCFGHIDYDYASDDQDIEKYFEQLKFTETQKRAYYDARTEYLKREAA